MPKKMTDRDRILAFAFKADAAELSDAIGVLKAALAAKGGGGERRSRGPRTTRKPTPAAPAKPEGE